MDFKLSKEQEMLQKVAKEFGETRLVPIQAEVEKTNIVPPKIFKEMGELGLMALPISEEYGGAAAGYDGYVLVMEQLAQIDSPVSAMMSAHVLGMSILETFGTEAQKAEYLPKGVSGEDIFSFAFTEPATGSDPKAITATAKKEGDKWVLNGTKRFITNVNYPGVMGCVFKEAESGKLVTFYFKKDIEGYSYSEPWDKIAGNDEPLHDVYFKNCIVSDSNMVGKIGDGFSHLISGIGYGKLGIASSQMGIAQAAYDIALDYALTKTQRGKPIMQFQGIQIQIAEMYQKLESMRWLLYRIACEANWNSKNNFTRFAKDAAVAKNYCSNTSIDITRHALNVMGSYGLMKDYKLEKLYRQATFGAQVEGSPHMQAVIIANAIQQGC